MRSACEPRPQGARKGIWTSLVFPRALGGIRMSVETPLYGLASQGKGYLFYFAKACWTGPGG
ncbi:MAG: hypothetical protein AB1512_26255 [Thermodesulfobacteriota bacterium]